MKRHGKQISWTQFFKEKLLEFFVKIFFLNFFGANLVNFFLASLNIQKHEKFFCMISISQKILKTVQTLETRAGVNFWTNAPPRTSKLGVLTILKKNSKIMIFLLVYLEENQI